MRARSTAAEGCSRRISRSPKTATSANASSSAPTRLARASRRTRARPSSKVIWAPVTQMRNTSSTTYSRGTWVASSAATSDWSTRKRTRSASRETSGPWAAACTSVISPWRRRSSTASSAGRSAMMVSPGVRIGGDSISIVERKAPGWRRARKTPGGQDAGRRGRAAASAAAAAGAGAGDGTAGGGVPARRAEIDGGSLRTIAPCTDTRSAAYHRQSRHAGDRSHAATRRAAAPTRRLPRPHAAPGDGHPAGVQPLRLLRARGGGRAQRARAGRVPQPRPALRARASPASPPGTEALALAAGAEPLQPHRHHPAARGHERGRAGPARRRRRARDPGGRAGLRQQRAHGLPRPPRRLRGGPRVPLAGRRAHPRRHRQGRGGPPERRPRHRGRRRAGHPRHRGQRPLLLLAAAHDLRRAAAPVAAAHLGGRQPGAEDPAHAGAAEDPPLPHLRGGVGGVHRLPRRHPGRDLRRRVPARRGARGGRRARVRADGARALSGRPHPPALVAAGERGARPRCRRRLPAQGIAGAAAGAAALHGRLLRLRPLRVPHPGRPRGRPRPRPARAGGEAARGARGERRLPRRAQPLLEVAEGAHRVPPRPPAAPADGGGVRGRRRGCAAT